MNFSKEANELFKTHPTVEEFYFTSDGMAFFTYDNAIAHSKSLKNKDVVKVTSDGDIDEAGIDTASKVVYIDKDAKNQIEAVKEGGQAKVVETTLSASEKEAIETSDDKKVEMHTEPGLHTEENPLPEKSDEEKEIEAKAKENGFPPRPE